MESKQICLDILNVEPLEPPQLVTPEVLETANRIAPSINCPDYPKKTTKFTDTQLKPADFKYLKKISDSVLDVIGCTPLIRLDRFAKRFGIECELLAKCEFLNPGGSVKDRIGLQMITEAEIEGRIKPGDALIEATSGNAGIALCVVSAVKGYHLIITMPRKMSQEKYNTLKGLGAEIVWTPTEAAWNEKISHISRAYQLQKILPNAHVLDQYQNPGNPRAHYLGTAEEILYQCDYLVDAVVVTAGTGGTASGIARKMKEKVPHCQIVGVDPYGSSLAKPSNLNDSTLGKPYLIEGIGYDFVPSSLDRSCIDKWVKSDDTESFRLARELIKLEGLLVGGSSGSALAGALKYAKNLKKNQRCVVILPDSCRNYMTKMMSDDWMIDNGFLPFCPPKSVPDKYKVNIAGLLASKSPVKRISKTATWSEAITVGKGANQEFLIVTDDDETLGILPLEKYLKCILTEVDKSTSILPYIDKTFPSLRIDATVVEAVQKLQCHRYCVVVNFESKIEGIITPSDVVY